MHGNTKKILLAATLLSTVALPMVALAGAVGFVSFPYWPGISDAPLLPCAGRDCVNACQFIVFLQHVFYFLLTLGVLVAAPIMVAVGGLMVLMGGTSSTMISTGKSILWGVLVGLVAALIAWIVISTLINVMKATQYIKGFGSDFDCKWTTLSIPSSP